MLDLLDFLIHPTRWSAIDELPSSARLLLSLGIFALSIVVAAVTGALSSRWARSRAERAHANGLSRQRAVRIRRSLVLLVFALGAYSATQVAPLPPHIDHVIGGAAYVLGALVLARVVIDVVTLLLTTSVQHVSGEERARLEREYVPLTAKITTLAVSLILVVVVAKHFGQDVTSLIAALGVGSLAIGLAAQQTLGNMIAGFVLLVDRPFRPGDRIRLATGESGEVLEVGVRSTRILLADHNLLIVPNAELVNSRVVNFAQPSSATRGEVKVVVTPGADSERALALLTEAAQAEDRVTPGSASARISALLPTGIELSAGFEVKAHADVPLVEDRVRRLLLKRFREEKIALAVAAPALPS